MTTNQQIAQELLTIRSGVIGVRNPMTQEGFYCKNWRQK